MKYADSKPTVLLTDDEERFLLSTSKILKNKGYETVTAKSGEDAIAILKEKSFDVVVLDIKMPGMTGIETLKEFKKIDPEIQVIILTGHASVDSAVDGIRLGAYEFLLKPCDIDDLIDIIDGAYEVKTARRKKKS